MQLEASTLEEFDAFKGSDMEVVGGNSYTEPYYDFSNYVLPSVSVPETIDGSSGVKSNTDKPDGYTPYMALAGFRSSKNGGKVYSIYDTIRIPRTDAFGHCSYQYPAKFMENLQNESCVQTVVDG